MAHPKVKVQASKMEKILNLLSLLLIIGMFGYTFYVYSSLPDTIAIHFNGAGEADEWGSKATIHFLPIFVALLFIGMFILSKFPHIFNYPIQVTEENAPRVYPIARNLVAIINFECVALFAYLQVDMIRAAIDGESNISFVYAILFIFVPLVTCFLFIIKLGKVEK